MTFKTNVLQDMCFGIQSLSEKFVIFIGSVAPRIVCLCVHILICMRETEHLSSTGGYRCCRVYKPPHLSTAGCDRTEAHITNFLKFTSLSAYYR